MSVKMADHTLLVHHVLNNWRIQNYLRNSELKENLRWKSLKNSRNRELFLSYVSFNQMVMTLTPSSSIGTANKILEAKEKERSKEDKGKSKETPPRKKAKR